MKNKNPLRALLYILLALIFGYGLSWIVIVGIIKLVTVCFGLGFNLAHATGIWLVFVLFMIVFHRTRGRKDG